MGACCSTTNSAIDRKCRADARKHNSVTTITGTPYAKNALWKPLELSMNPDFVTQNASNITKSLRYQILDCVIGLVEQCNILYATDPIKYCDCKLILDSRQMTMMDEIAICYKTGLLRDLTENEWSSLCQCVEYIWKLECVQNTYQCIMNVIAIATTNDDYERKQLQDTVVKSNDDIAMNGIVLDANCIVFMSSSRLPNYMINLGSIMSADYVPTKEDYLLINCNHGPFGIPAQREFQYHYFKDKNRGEYSVMVIRAVEAQSLLKKTKFNDAMNTEKLGTFLIGVFPANIITFAASLIDFKNKAFGINPKWTHKNAMLESIQLFGKIATLPCFDHDECIIHLLFTHYKEFCDMVRQNDQRLIDSFETYPEWTKIHDRNDGNDCTDKIERSVKFIAKLYLQSFRRYCKMKKISTTYDRVQIRNEYDLSFFTSHIDVWAFQHSMHELAPRDTPDKWLALQGSLLLPSHMEMDDESKDSADWIRIDIDDDKFYKITKNYDELINKNKMNNITHNKTDYITSESQCTQIDRILVNTQQIGQGGFATVYKGFDMEYKMGIAVKIVEKADRIRSSNLRYRWLATHEVDCLANVSHDNVIKLLRYNLNAPYQNNNCMMFVLEYAKNGDLTHFIKQMGYIPEILARTYFRQIIQGLKACHEAFVIHRDIKCDNILLDENYNIKISDFGLSTVALRVAVSMYTVGATHYVVHT